MGEDLMDVDPLCSYVPKGGPTIVPLAARENRDIRWSDEAAQRLARVPAFVRRLVKQRAEAFVMELGENLVTVQHLSTLSARRFGEKGPPWRNAGAVMD